MSVQTNKNKISPFYSIHALHAGGSGVRLYDDPDLKRFILVGWGRSFLSVAWPTGVQLVLMPPTLKKLEGHIAFGLSVCVCVCVRLLTFEWSMLGI